MVKPAPFVTREDEREVERWSDPERGDVLWRTLLSADRTPTQAMTVGIAELPAGSTQAPRLHRHEQPEVYYVLEGQGRITISGRSYEMTPGATVFIPGAAEHCAVNTGTGTLRILYVLAADSFSDVEYEFCEEEPK